MRGGESDTEEGYREGGIKREIGERETRENGERDEEMDSLTGHTEIKRKRRNEGKL